jgi:hypothetical protein
MAYRVIYGETMPSWEQTFPTWSEAAAFATKHESLGDVIFSVALVAPGEKPKSLQAMVHVSMAEKRAGIPECGDTEGKCPRCSTPLVGGFGLAGGGYGVYEYCPNEQCAGDVVTKSIVKD